MMCSVSSLAAIATPKSKKLFSSISNRAPMMGTPALNFWVPSSPIALLKETHNSLSPSILRSQSASNPPGSGQDQDEEEDSETLVQDLRIPLHWLVPSKALEESEWLRITLHKWLDDEYCPEPTNVEISKVAARSYYESLVERETDLGVILLKMAGELETISYQESFHGAFSSANAAINLIIDRIEKS